jgi:hypothetical protein
MSDIKSLIGKKVVNAYAVCIHNLDHEFIIEFDDGSILKWCYENQEGSSTIARSITIEEV